PAVRTVWANLRWLRQCSGNQLVLSKYKVRWECALTAMSEKGKVLTLRVTAWNSRDHGARRVDSGLLAEQVVGDLLVTNPNVHLTADGVAEDTIVFIAEFLHGE